MYSISHHRPEQGAHFVRILLLVTLLLGSHAADAQQVTVSNNLLYDAWLTPNLRAGIRLSEHWSTGLTAGFNPWPASDRTTRKWRHLLVSPDVRYWTDSVNVGHFFGANLIYSHYNVSNVRFPFGLYKSVRHERRQGDLGALGVFYGYAWPLSRHWSLEAVIGVAGGYTQFTSYQCGHCGKKLKKQRKWFAMPQAALNVVYSFPGRTPRPLQQEPVLPTPLPEDTVAVEPAPVQEVAVVTPPAPVVERRTTPLVSDPMVASTADYRPYDPSRVLRKEPGIVYVYFPFVKSTVEPGFRDNASTLERIVSVTRRMMADSICRVSKIQIVGLSSVEGPVALNQRLSQQRANALQAYVQQQVGVPDSLFDTVGGGEAWADFRDMLADMKGTGTPVESSIQKALDIIDSESAADWRERRLKRLDGGRLWRYVLQQRLLSDQRNACYIRIYYDAPPQEQNTQP